MMFHPISIFFYLRIGAFHGFLKIFPRYHKDRVVLIELCRQVLEVNTLCLKLKKIVRIPFLIVVGPYYCASRSNSHNLVKAFDNIVKLIDYEVIRPQYGPINFVKDHLKLGYSHRHVPDTEDYWVGCYDEYQTREMYWSRLTLDDINFYNDTY